MRASMKGCLQGSSSTGRRRVYVLDAAGFFAGLPLMAPEQYYTSPRVLGELLDPRSRGVAEQALELGRLVVRDPGPEAVGRTRRRLRNLDPRGRLSETDLEVLALAALLVEEGFEVVVVSDDYLVQRAAELLGACYMPVRTIGVDRAGRVSRFS